MIYLGTVVKPGHGEIKAQPEPKAFSLIRKRIMQDNALVFFHAAVERAGELKLLSNFHIINAAFEQSYKEDITWDDLIMEIKNHLGV
jgi:hypothetical protein